MPLGIPGGQQRHHRDRADGVPQMARSAVLSPS